MAIKTELNTEKLPKHIAIIMDGNGRWAKKRALPRVVGHEYGVRSVRKITEAAAEIGIQYLTLYTFSTENWNRPPFEINALMNLLVKSIRKEVKSLMEQNIRLQTIGDISLLPTECYKELEEAKELTKNNTRLTLVLALNYSARWDIANACKKIAHLVTNNIVDQNNVNEALIQQHLSTVAIPEPELLIRTSGELRISNFMLWECAYSEFYFTDTFWPDFNKEDFIKAIINYQQRERRFGKTSEQLEEKK